MPSSVMNASAIEITRVFVCTWFREDPFRSIALFSVGQTLQILCHLFICCVYVRNVMNNKKSLAFPFRIVWPAKMVKIPRILFMTYVCVSCAPLHACSFALRLIFTIGRNISIRFFFLSYSVFVIRNISFFLLLSYELGAGVCSKVRGILLFGLLVFHSC